jgi:YesN/AraC family two-component response regulator
LTEDQYDTLQTEVKIVGFELLEDKNERLVNRIKSIIISDIYEGEGFNNQNLSVNLSEQLHYDYSHLSNLFTALEGKRINTFQQNIKIERIKELLEYDELSIGQIADDLGFGNSAYHSTAFKKHTGISPSQYRRLHLKNRKVIDSA